jgi:hypothetical protein
MMFWRLIFGKVASMSELHEWWTLEDVMDANDIMDAKEAAERLTAEATKR